MRRLARVVFVLGTLAAVVALLGPVLIALREREDGRTLPAGVPGRLVAVGGRRVHVVERGAGAPLLLVHGLGGSADDFEESVLEPVGGRAGPSPSI